ncbi:MAG: hypothetical protein HGA38_01200 [Candidatus Moranbacteria bacterium]|nr:hypothetical protein [Candidatus Moranbacteria bacterium]NTW45625.1 hypothetical protein [Candidatus Moranbacteria bacterium]
MENDLVNLRQIYERFSVPPNLAEHMETVAQVVRVIRDHWIGESVDWDFIIQAALLHDIGNIVKFDFEAHPEFLGDEAKNVEYWKEVRTDIIARYGNDDHLASGNMLREIGVSDELLSTIQNKSFANAIDVAAGNDWNAKILLYADMRVMPHGVTSLEERLADVRRRMPQYYRRLDFEELLDAARDIETQITAHLDKAVTDITWVENEGSDDNSVRI